MNVVILGVLAGLDASVLIVMLLSLLGAATLMLLALARGSVRNLRAVQRLPVLVTPLRACPGAGMDRQERVRVCGSTRAPPDSLQRERRRRWV